MSVTITYGTKFTTLETRKVGTLPCANKLMTYDISLSFKDYGGTVSYNGATTWVEANATATLPCKGKVAKTDIQVSSTDIKPASEDAETVETSE